MSDEVRMKGRFEILEEFLRSEGWEPELVPGHRKLRMRYATGNGAFTIYCFIPTGTATLVVLGVPDFVVPPERRASAMELVVRMNWGMRVGCFELNLKDGEVRYKGTLDYYDCPLSPGLMRNLLNGCVTVMHDCLPVLSAFVNEGKSPTEALALMPSL